MTSYEDVVRLLLEVLTMKYENNDNNFIEYIAVSILNSLACQVDYTEKRTQGDLGAVQVITMALLVTVTETKMIFVTKISPVITYLLISTHRIIIVIRVV